MSASTSSRGVLKVLIRAVVLAAVSMLAVSCGVPQRGESSTSDPMVSVEQSIVARMQGAQLDVWGGGEPSPGGTTSMFVHRGHRAAEVYWTTDGWCVARLFTWSVEHAVSATRFDVRYEADRKFDDCVAATDDELVLEVYDESPTDGRRILLGAYPEMHGTWTTRTACTTTGAALCGFPAAAAAAEPWM